MMRWLGLSVLLFSITTRANQISPEEFAERLQDGEFQSALQNEGFAKAKERVDASAVTDSGQARYCTGYLCAHFSADFCDRNEESCRYASSGSHALVMMKHEVELPDGKGRVEHYCIYEPQLGRALDKDLCWLRHPQDSALKPWSVPPHVDRKYRELFPTMLEADDKPFVADDKNPYDSKWNRWWENVFHSDGQLMSVCDQQNKLAGGKDADPIFDALPNEMPLCSSMGAEECKNDSQAKACRLKTPMGRNVCKTMKCIDKQWTWMSWEWSAYPSCEGLTNLNAYCADWKKKFLKNKEGLLGERNWEYGSKNTRHYCRVEKEIQNENYGIKQFSCDLSGNANVDFGTNQAYLPTRPVQKEGTQTEPVRRRVIQVEHQN